MLFMTFRLLHVLPVIEDLGSLLGLCLVVQLVRGVFLAMHYSCDVRLAFESVRHIVRDVNFGWGLRSLHSNGARIFFIFIYLHVSRGLYYGSYRFKNTWLVGRVILLLVIGTAFLGYVLPWGQISFWVGHGYYKSSLCYSICR